MEERRRWGVHSSLLSFEWLLLISLFSKRGGDGTKVSLLELFRDEQGRCRRAMVLCWSLCFLFSIFEIYGQRTDTRKLARFVRSVGLGISMQWEYNYD